MGRIEQVLVREGDAVRAGQTLVVLDDAALRNPSRQAQAGAAAQETTIRRQRQCRPRLQARWPATSNCRREQSVSPQEMDEVTRRAEAAQAQLDAAHAQSEAGGPRQAARKPCWATRALPRPSAASSLRAWPTRKHGLARHAVASSGSRRSTSTSGQCGRVVDLGVDWEQRSKPALMAFPSRCRHSRRNRSRRRSSKSQLPRQDRSAR